VGLAGAEGVRVRVLVLMADDAWRKFLDSSFWRLEHQSVGLLLGDFLDHFNFSLFGEGDIHLSGHGLRERNLLINIVCFDLVKCYILDDGTTTDFVNIFEDNRRHLTSLGDLDEDRYLESLRHAVGLRNLNDSLTADYLGDLADNGAFVDDLFGRLSEHLDGLVLLLRAGCASAGRVAAAAVCLALARALRFEAAAAASVAAASIFV